MNKYQIPIIVQSCKTRLEQPHQQSVTPSPTASTEVSSGYEHSSLATPTQRAQPITRPATAMATYSPQRSSRIETEVFAMDSVSHFDPRAAYNSRTSMVEMQHSTNPFRAPTPRIAQHPTQSPWAPMSNPGSALLPPVRPASARQHELDEITRPWSPLNPGWVGFQLEHDGMD